MIINGDFNVRDFDLVFVDLEFSGLDLGQEVLEIGFVKVKAGTHEVLLEKDIKIKPKHIETADPEALKVNGYDPAEWEREGVSLEEGVAEFLKHSEGTMLVGHNLPMDWMFLQKAIETCGRKPNYLYKGLDTYSLAWLLLRGNSDIKRFSLGEICKRFGIEQLRSHRALDDAQATCKAFLSLLAEYERQTQEK